MLQWKGLVSARRSKALEGEGEDAYQYMGVDEIQDEATYRRLMVKALGAENDANFGAVSERGRVAYPQVWP